MSSYRMKYKIGLVEYSTTVPTDINEKVINKRIEITTSGTWTAPFTSWYKFTIKGAGGGGMGGYAYSTGGRAGGGGGEGGTTFAFRKLEAGTSVTIVIGAGGTGGVSYSTDRYGTRGKDGGNTTLTVGATTYTAGGGGGGYTYGGAGGTGDISGVAGGSPVHFDSSGCEGASGGGSGGANGKAKGANNGTKGGGGSGGYAVYTGAGTQHSPYDWAGGKGGNGIVVIEYFDPTLTS